MDTSEMKLDLKALWAKFRSANPRVRIREAAKQLGTSEVELLATGLGDQVTRLTTAEREHGWGAIIEKIPTLGRVLALTRNEYCIHERRGTYREIDCFGQTGSVVGPDIDLRLFLRAWKFGFAVEEQGKSAVMKRSLQFFDRAGVAIHKVFLEENSNVPAFEAILREFRDPNQDSPAITMSETRKPDKPDDEIDVKDFRGELAALRNTHDFFGLLRKFELGRVQALRLAGNRFAERVSADVAGPLLRKAAEKELPIMVFVGNHGIIQIHTGAVCRIMPFGENGEWINVLDGEFNLHLLQTGVHEAWVTRKPTQEGHVTSIELFDSAGDMVVQFFGKRKPGKPELPSWRSLVAELETDHPYETPQVSCSEAPHP